MLQQKITTLVFIVFFSQISPAEEMMQAFKKFGIIKQNCESHAIETTEALVNVLTSATCAAYTRLLFLQVPQQNMIKTRLAHHWNTGEKSEFYFTQGRCAIPRTSADLSDLVYENGAKFNLKLKKQSEKDGSYLFHGQIGRKSIRVVLKNMPNLLNSCQIGQQVQIKEFKIGSGIFDYLTFPFGANLNFKEFQSSGFQQKLIANKSISNTSDYEGVELLLRHHQIQGLSEVMSVRSTTKQSNSIQIHFSNIRDQYFGSVNELEIQAEQMPAEHYYKTTRFRYTEGCSILTANNDLLISQLEDCENE